jgi:hypothetical protein
MSRPDAPSARPVLQQAPKDPGARQRLAAWLGVLEADLDRVFKAAGGPLPLAGPTTVASAEARTEALEKLGLPATLATGARPFAHACATLLKVGLLALLLFAIGNAVATGITPFVGPGPPGPLAIFGLVLPTFFAGVTAGLTLPIALILYILGVKRQRESSAQLSRAAAVVDELAGYNLSEAAAPIDERARALARRILEADLGEIVTGDLLAAVSECRAALRGDPPEGALATVAAELDALDRALGLRLTEAFTSDDLSAPLARLRAANRALKTPG